MDQALLGIIALGAVVWLAIFGAAKFSKPKTAGLRAAARQEAIDLLLDAHVAQVANQEVREPPLPTMSLYEALKQQVATYRIKRDAEGRFAATSSSASSSRQSKAARERA